MHNFLKTTCVLLAVAAFVCTGLTPAQAVEKKAAPEAATTATPTDAAKTNAAMTMPCGCAMTATAMSPEKKAKYDAIVKEAETQMAPLQEQMLAKGIELQAMTQTPKTDQPAIALLAKDMAALHQKLVAVHDQMLERLAKEAGVVPLRENRGCNRCGLHRGANPGLNQHHGHNGMELSPLMPTD